MGSTRRDRLRAALEAFRPSPGPEAGFRQRMLDLLDGEGDPFARDRFVPGHFTASAFVLSPDGEALLMILHERLGRWLQPGGHVDPGDSDLEESARREVLEETSLGALRDGGGILDLDIHPIPARPGAPRHEHFDVRFAFRAASRKVAGGSDARDVRWVPLAELRASASEQALRRVLRKLPG